jgi:hypothetical protein
MTSQSIPMKPVVVALCAAAAFAVQAAAAADISATLTRAAAAAKADNHAAAAEALEQALASVRREAPLALAPFVVVAQPAKFYGDYEPRAGSVFRRSETLRFYMEPKNLVYGRAASGVYEPAFEVDLEILTASGKTIYEKPRFGVFRLAARSAVQDIFMNLAVALTGAPAGDYTIRFVVRDLNSKKAATVSKKVTLE